MLFVVCLHSHAVVEAKEIVCKQLTSSSTNKVYELDLCLTIQFMFVFLSKLRTSNWVQNTNRLILTLYPNSFPEHDSNFPVKNCIANCSQTVTDTETMVPVLTGHHIVYSMIENTDVTHFAYSPQSYLAAWSLICIDVADTFSVS